MRRALILLLLLLCVGGSTSAAVDESRLEPPDPAEYLKWGPLRVRPGLALTNLGYDDNILFTSTQEKVGDYTATLSPRLDGLVLLGSRAFVTFDERLDYTLYLHNSGQNYLNNRLRSRVTVPLGEWAVFADVLTLRRRARPVDREDIPNREIERRLGGGIIARLGWRTEVEVGYSAGTYSNEDPDFVASMPGQVDPVSLRLDRGDRVLRLDADYRLRGRTWLAFEGLRKSIDFDYPTTVNGTTVARNTLEHRWTTGVRFGEGGPLTGSLLAGVGTIDAEDPALADLREIVGEGELALRLGGTTRLIFEVSRLPGFALSEANSYYLDSRWGVRAVRFFNRIVGVEAGGNLGRLTFPAQVGAGEARRDDLQRYDIGLRLRTAQTDLGRRVEYRIRLGRYRRESNVIFANQSKTTFTIDAVVGY